MRARQRRRLPFQNAVTTLAVFFLLGASGCSETSGPAADSCPADLKSVDAKITTGSTVVLDWSPRCPVALVLIEEDASDQWVVSAADLDDDLTEADNRLMPPITYGVAPSTAKYSDQALQLVPGRKYELILWRVLPGGAEALVAVKEFVR